MAISFYVSPAPTGNDSNACTIGSPCATIARGIAAMVAGTGTNLVVNAGTYQPAATLALTTADNNMAIQGNGAVTLDGSTAGTLISMAGTGMTIQGLGFANATAPAIIVNGGTTNTITGNKFSNCNEGILLENGANANTITANVMTTLTVAGIEVKNQSSGNMIGGTNYALGNTIYGIAGLETQTGGVYAHGANNTTVSHNLINGTQGTGISFSDFDTSDTATQNLGAVISSNVVLNSCLGSTDCGSIYVLGRSLAQTNTSITGNVVSGTGRSTQHSVGIYLDDNASGVTVSGNLVSNIGTDAFQVHGGNNDTITGNIFDLGAGAPSAGLFQSDAANQPNPNTLINNVDKLNTFITSSSAPKNPLIANLAGGTPTYGVNVYYSTRGVTLTPGN